MVKHIICIMLNVRGCLAGRNMYNNVRGYNLLNVRRCLASRDTIMFVDITC